MPGLQLLHAWLKKQENKYIICKHCILSLLSLNTDINASNSTREPCLPIISMVHYYGQDGRQKSWSQKENL